MQIASLCKIQQITEQPDPVSFIAIIQIYTCLTSHISPIQTWTVAVGLQYTPRYLQHTSPKYLMDCGSTVLYATDVGGRWHLRSALVVSSSVASPRLVVGPSTLLVRWLGTHFLMTSGIRHEAAPGFVLCWKLHYSRSNVFSALDALQQCTVYINWSLTLTMTIKLSSWRIGLRENDDVTVDVKE